MNLFINAVSQKGVLIIFDDTSKIITKREIEVLGNESSKLVGKIDDFLDESKIIYNDIKNIVVVNGPGSFTGIRTISLIINTISYVGNQKLTPMSYFDLFKTYPICKPSSRRDTFIQKSENSGVEIMQNPDLEKYLEENNISTIYGELNPAFFEDTITIDEIDYENIISNIELKDKKIIEPLYIKKPSIT